VAGLPAWARQRLTGFADRVAQVIGGSPVVHFDETGTQVGGRNRWVHVVCTPSATLYHLDDRRGQNAIDAAGILAGPRAPQVAVHDGWMSYLNACYTGVNHAHHLRELVGWTQHDPIRHGWAQPMIDLLREGNHLVR